MLSRKVSGSSLMSQTIGIDRGRVGERLQAALAGLQELHLLKEKQRHMVHWAMRMDHEESESSTLTRSDSERLYGEEQRLEATLTSLKQQLCRLRRQDVGLKTHLQHLDEQISELKLDVSKASTEQLENDSRPSSGFYELSDGGSCSLSNSCTSVYSECLSSSSQSNLVPAACFGGPSPHHGPSHVEASRRRSADESTTHVNVLRATGLHLGSSRIRSGAAGPERARQRPVSTGDLDRMLTQGLVYNKCGDAKTPAPCGSPRASTVDPKFQSSLVSRSGIEVYHYPSPLHAVALQSPIFSPSMEPATPAAPGAQGPPGHSVPSLDTLPGDDDRAECRPLGYIHKVLQRGTSKLNVQVEAGREAVRPNVGYRREAAGNPVVVPVRAPAQRCLPAHTVDAVPANRMRQCVVRSSQEQVDRCHPGQILSTPVLEPSHRYSYPTALRDCSPREAIPGWSQAPAETTGEKTRPDTRLVEVSESRLPERRGCERRSELAHGSSTEEGPGFEGRPAPRVLPDFVHAKYVPAGSQQVKVRPADRKTKAVKLRKKSSEKPRAVKHQLSYSSSERSRDTSEVARGDPELRGPGKGKSSLMLASRLGEERRRSGSESSLCGPAHLCSHRVHPQPQPVSATKPGKDTRPQGLDLELRAEQRKKRQGAPRWPSDLKILHAMHAQGQRSREPHAQGRSVMVRGSSARPHSGQRSGPPRSLQPSLSPSSYFDHLNARYPPAPFPRPGRYPPRCESEYSAECASLFHSTIAESSEEEMSDNTTNRFGDSESSQSSPSPSDSDSSLSMDGGDHIDGVEDERGLVWAKATVGPTAAGLTLQQVPRPEPPACRIKASRALKKKIRRFQSASLKVMTLV